VRLDRPFFNACAGRFSVIEAAIKQGFPAAEVHASDIGLFSSLTGYLADESKRLEDLGIRILDPELEPRDTSDELDFAAQWPRLASARSPNPGSQWARGWLPAGAHPTCADAGSTPLAAIVLLCNQLSAPGQEGVRSDGGGGHFMKHAPAQFLGLKG
jgi:hypothetical protein